MKRAVVTPALGSKMNRILRMIPPRSTGSIHEMIAHIVIKSVVVESQVKTSNAFKSKLNDLQQMDP
jgi:hypothetical protein